MSHAIKIEDLRFDYPVKPQESGGRTPFGLDIPAWRLKRGDAVAIYGPSGGGKSTFLELAAGILRPTAGRLLVHGTNLAALDERQRRAFRLRHIGMVFQDFPLVEHLDLGNNVTLPYRLAPELHLDSKVEARALGLLQNLGLEERRGDLPRTLSQGERQRVAIARALVTQPTLVLADEPTAGLDPEHGAAVVDLMKSLCHDDTSLLLVSHDPSVLKRIDQRVDVRQWRSTEKPRHG